MDEQVNETGTSELHLAVLQSDMAQVRRLIAAGADADRANRAGFTPLHFAAHTRHHEIAQLLVDAGADLEARNQFNVTPLVFAQRSAHQDSDDRIIDVLIELGADPEAGSGSVSTPPPSPAGRAEDASDRSLRGRLRGMFGRRQSGGVSARDQKELEAVSAAGCMASVLVSLGARPVGYMYREQPDGGWDSGWRFLAGDETPEFLDDPDNLAIVKVSTIRALDPSLPAELLLSPCGAQIAREGPQGTFVRVDHG